MMRLFAQNRWRWALALLLLVLPVAPSAYWLRIINMAMINALMVLGLNFILGATGQLSLGHAAFFGLGAYTSALLTVGHSGGWFWLALPAAGLLTALVSAFVGVATLRLKGHYLALATSGFGEATVLLLINWDKVTHGSDGITNIPSPLLFGFEFDSNTRMYYLILVACVVLVAAAWYLLQSTYGRAMLAVKQNELAAQAMGVDVMRVKLVAFIASAVYAGVAGSLYAHATNYISPGQFGFELTALALMGLMVGGAGTVSGPIVGAVLITVLPESFRAFKVAYMLIFGVAVMVLMGLMPDGVVGLIRRLTAPRREVKPVGSVAGD